MLRFTSAIRRSIDAENWYSALSLSLLLPDICGRIDDPTSNSSEKRYVKWFEEWLQPKYTHEMYGGKLMVFLSGGDCYALRCALSHEGRGDISKQRARDVLSEIIFNTPHPKIHIHCNRINGALQLQVDLFAIDVCEAVEQWYAVAKTDPVRASQMDELITIHDTSGGIPGILSVG